MPQNDKIILNQILSEKHTNLAPALDDDHYFGIFTAEQILKDFDLSYDEISSGSVDGGGDGGIDSFFVLVNGELLHEDSDFSDLRKNIVIDVFIIQSKSSDGFSENAVEKLIISVNDLFDLSKDLTALKQAYNQPLLEAVDLFRRTYQQFASKFPKLRFSFRYATKGDGVHPNVQRKVERLKDAIKIHFSAAEFDFIFLTAGQLLDLARKSPKTSYELRLTESPISASEGVAFICLVSLADFQKFISDAQGKLIRHIFEANVRDYQGKTQVNEQIQSTLQQSGGEDFWWLNNGVSILASQATLSGKMLTIENPEIVNGLQTSTEIFNYFSASNTTTEKRSLLIRVIVPSEAESRDRIIRATNSQTAIVPASLRATDRIHRDIEQYLKAYNYYYDRRKNFYKNEGKPINRIISIAQLAQAVESIALNRPDTARARPSSLIKKDDDYMKLFDPAYPISIYRACIEIIKATETYLNDHPDNLSVATKNDLKYYVAMIYSHLMLEEVSPPVERISTLAGKSVEASKLLDSYKLVLDVYNKLGASDQVAKGTQMLKDLNDQMQSRFVKK